MSKPTIVIKGFKSKEQAEEFMTWYSEQGEQDLSAWLEIADVGCDSMYSKGTSWSGDQATMTIEPLKDDD